MTVEKIFGTPSQFSLKALKNIYLKPYLPKWCVFLSTIYHLCTIYHLQGVIQGVFEIGNRFWARENRRPNFDKLTENEVFTKPLISKHKANHKLPPMYIKRCKLVF